MTTPTRDELLAKLLAEESAREALGFSPNPPGTSELDELAGKIDRLSDRIEALADDQGPQAEPAGQSDTLLRELAELREAIAKLSGQLAATPSWHAKPSAKPSGPPYLATTATRADRLGGLQRVALAAIPIAVIALTLWSLVVPIAEILGIGPIASWVWSSFDAAETSLVRLLIALGWFAALGAVGYGAYRAGKVLAAVYQGRR